MFDVLEFSERVQNDLVKYSTVLNIKRNLEDSVSSVEEEIGVLKNKLEIYNETKPYLDDVIYKFSVSSVKKLEALLNLALKSIFFDREYTVEIVLSEKRGSKSAEFFISENGSRVPLNDGYVGGGVLVVLGFVIQCYYIVSLNLNRTLFLDESLTFVSTEYLEPFMKFLQELSSKMNISVVMITHDVRFEPYANRVYRVKNGEYNLVR